MQALWILNFFRLRNTRCHKDRGIAFVKQAPLLENLAYLQRWQLGLSESL